MRAAWFGPAWLEIRRLAWLAATAVPLGLASAQTGDLETALREGQYYADCLNQSDLNCLLQMTHPVARMGSNVRDRWPLALQAAMIPIAIEQPINRLITYWHLEVESASRLEVDSELRFALLPYVLYSGNWREQRGYFIGVSDDGNRWCFIEDLAVETRGLNRFLPDYAGPALPAVSVTTRDAPGRMQSDYLETTLAGFDLINASGEAHYELRFEVRKKVREATPLVISFQNPAAIEQPFVTASLLAPGQAELRISSPLVTGLKPGTTYRVAVFGMDPTGTEFLFEHVQPMLFDPIGDRHDGFILAIANVRGPGFSFSGLFPQGWNQDRDASIAQLCTGRPGA